jgi:phosphoribosylglycinamide formyltransferase 1
LIKNIWFFLTIPNIYRFFVKNINMKHIAIFASGSGSNAKKIIDYFENHKKIKVSLVVSNKADAKVLDIAKDVGIDTFILNKTLFYETEQILQVLKEYKIDLVVLAGFLWLVPLYMVKAFENRMVNIHPSLLPKYGGKGMHGMSIHEAVAAAKEVISGITIHFVNEHYDQGNYIFQTSCALEISDDAATIAKKVLALEHKFFAPTIEKVLDITK